VAHVAVIPKDARDEFEERMALGKIAHCMASYRDIARPAVARVRQTLGRLPARHRALLGGLEARPGEMERCIEANGAFLDAVLDSFEPDDDRPLPPHLAAAWHAARVHVEVRPRGSPALGGPAPRERDPPTHPHAAPRRARPPPAARRPRSPPRPGARPRSSRGGGYPPPTSPRCTTS